MSSRQEEKARRRSEREAAEAEAARRASIKGRLQLAASAVGVVAVIALAVVLFGGGGGASGQDAPAPRAVTGIPPAKETDLRTAAVAAKCELRTAADEGRQHTTAAVTYQTNPPTSGNHDPVPADDGLYAAGNPPPVGKSVHALEHGRVDLQYKPGTPKATVDKLETLGSEALKFGEQGYKMLVFENQTKMQPAVAATAWTQSLTCPQMNDAVYDAVRDFRTAYTDKGPELIP